MAQTHIQPGSILKLPSGNVIRTGPTLNGVVKCQYINTEKFAEVVDLTVEWLVSHGDAA